jgi:hypothetical protein
MFFAGVVSFSFSSSFLKNAFRDFLEVRFIEAWMLVPFFMPEYTPFMSRISFL